MNKGLLFGIPVVIALVVALFGGGQLWTAIALLVSLGVVFFYIRRQKQHTNDEPGRKP